MEPIPWDPTHSYSHSWSHQAHSRRSLLAVCGESQPATMEKTDAPVTLPQEVIPLQSKSNKKPPCPLPGFVEIAQALQAEGLIESSKTLVVEIPPEEVEDT